MQSHQSPHTSLPVIY
uniref:Uncharacterized protein n=1 Tax=Arundo donax TaxID=35708 RepID=A0A0A8Z1X8_ARUDO